jgi:hypothetical protein
VVERRWFVDRRNNSWEECGRRSSAREGSQERGKITGRCSGSHSLDESSWSYNACLRDKVGKGRGYNLKTEGRRASFQERIKDSRLKTVSTAEQRRTKKCIYPGRWNPAGQTSPTLRCGLSVETGQSRRVFFRWCVHAARPSGRIHRHRPCMNFVITTS